MANRLYMNAVMAKAEAYGDVFAYRHPKSGEK